MFNCGRANDPELIERLHRLAKSILRRCSPEATVADDPGWRLVCAWPYDDVHALQAVWQQFGIDAIVRAQAHGRRFAFEMERALCFQVADLLSLDVEIVFYVTTSLHFEIDDEDKGDEAGQMRGSDAAGAKRYVAPRKRGYGTNGRGDAPQIVVGLAVTRDGFPVRHWVFPGNTVDVTTVAQVKDDLKSWQFTRCLFVGDAGLVSQANFQALAKGGGKYLMAMPMRRGDEVTEAVLSRPGRYRKIADNLEVKEVVVGDGERRRYAVCFNPQEARRQRAHRDERIRELEAELACLADQDENGHSKRVCALRSSARYGRLLKQTKRGLAIDRQAIAELECFDGKFVVHSNDDTLTAEDMALGYKQQQRVEEAWRTMKGRHASGVPLGAPPHPRPHRDHRAVAATGARDRARLPGYLAQRAR